MLPDAKWLEALSLPAKVTGGLTAFCIIALILDANAVVPLVLFGSIARPIVILGAILFGCLFIATMIDMGVKAWQVRNKPKILAQRRKAVKAEKEEERLAAQAVVVARLDHLSNDENNYVADALRENSQSFLTYVHSGPVTAMMGKGLIYTPGGTHHQDYYPFSFYDFVWNAVLERREAIIKRDDDYQAEQKKRR